MGVPAFFRWLSQKYPKIILPVIEEQPVEHDGYLVPVDTTGPNPNGEEQDNLYLDMNGIVHPCTHPEDKPPPETEEEMMLEVFKYTERVVAMVRPRKVLMMAVDGVAPRAKMNQQRSRRFRSAQEAKEKEEQVAEFVKLLANKGTVVDDSLKKRTWDTNAITPGTPFMEILSISLKYWVAYKLNTDPAWAKLKVIISDSSVPGEGEHKIMEFIRAQRSDPEHDPNTRHVIYGLDADLIMLGLATHEPHFRVLREDVFAGDNRARVCAICNQKGHRAEECTGKAREKQGQYDEKGQGLSKKPFIWLHVGVLREYLEIELKVPGMNFAFDIERAIDDWVFMCFFVGNDFLPHLPSLEIRDQGIEALVTIWRDNINVMGGYVTKDGQVDMARAQRILQGLGRQEDSIFRKRKEIETRKEESAKRRKLGQEAQHNKGAGLHRGKGERPPSDFPSNIPLFAASRNTADAQAKHDLAANRNEIRSANLANKSAAAALKSQLLSSNTDKSISDAPLEASESPMNSLTTKRKASVLEEGPDLATPLNSTNVSEANTDTVRLWEPGYRDRYYQQKFNKSPDDLDFRTQVGHAYVEGLCWVLLYYYQGCPSWQWFYPYHYAPFAQDITSIEDLKITFSPGQPFKPYEQLMAVLPAASKHNLPEEFGHLMEDPSSEIIDFYPTDFPLDYNGKKFAWQAIALLPFIDEQRLLQAVSKIYPKLRPEDLDRNRLGNEFLFVSEQHPLYERVAKHFFTKNAALKTLRLDSQVTNGLAGIVEKDETFIPHSTLTFPLHGVVSNEMRDLEDDRSMSLLYFMPKKTHPHKSMLLRGLKLNAPVLTAADYDTINKKQGSGGKQYHRPHSFDNDRRGGRPYGGRSYQDSSMAYNPPPGVRGPPLQPGFGFPGLQQQFPQGSSVPLLPQTISHSHLPYGYGAQSTIVNQEPSFRQDSRRGYNTQGTSQTWSEQTHQGQDRSYSHSSGYNQPSTGRNQYSNNSWRR